MLNYIYEHDNLKKKSKSECRITNNELTSHLFRYSKFSCCFFVGLKLILSYKTENTIFEIG